jgi:dTDP-3,4-didehydro-2,6-dideoxy-alpha-D-glucose 3-reductase
MEQIRIGILGCADIAGRSILPALTALNTRYVVAGIASRDNNKAREFSERFNIKYSCDYNSLLDKNLIDMVYIPLPNSLHYEWVLKAIECGVHVLVEKSLTCSFDQTREIIEKAREKNLAVIENFQFRFHPQMDYIFNVLNNNEIGELRSIRSSFGFPPFADKNNIRYSKQLGGGALLDAGAYPVKITQMLMGNKVLVNAAKLFYDDERGIDLWGGAFLASESSPLFSEIAFGFDNFYQCNLELWGSKGKITADRIFTAPPEFQPTVTIETKSGKKNELIPAGNHFINMLEYVYDLIRHGDFTEEYNQNLNQAELIESIRRTTENN